jgi:NAD(P)-dependent dehydrogenase (short-subunit alcohol dehydrogenase family)
VKVEGRTVVVTGAGSGIGAAMARRFAAEGARAVIVADLALDAARAVAEGCRDASGHSVGHAHRLDVADAAATEALIDSVERRHGPIGLFCANAGLGLPGGREPDAATWQRLWDVHVMAHVHAARVLLPRWHERAAAEPKGWLLITASAAGLLSQPDAPYAVTKHAAVAFAEWLAIQHGGEGVGISCLCPGAVDTPLLRAESAERQKLMNAGEAPMPPETVADIVVQGLADERFLILTHPQVAQWVQRKAADPERRIHGIRKGWRRSG